MPNPMDMLISTLSRLGDLIDAQSRLVPKAAKGQHTGGYSRSITQLTGTQIPAASIDVNFDDAAFYTLQFSPANQQSGVAARATINWKCEGNQQQRIFDVANGASITGFCHGVSIQISDISVGEIANTPTEYTITVAFTKGVRPDTQAPPTLQDYSPKLIDDGDNFDFEVPQNAGVNRYYVTVVGPTNVPLTSGDILIQEETSDGTVIKYVDPLITMGWIPLSNGVSDVVIQNNTGSGKTVAVTLIWGVDG